MGSIIGFTATSDLTEDRLTAALAAQCRALSYFPHVERLSLRLGETSLELWGHRPLSDRVHSLADGSLLVLIGSPHGDVSWSDLEESLAQATQADDFELPWEGRVILLRISADGKRWTMWNDWTGSIPVFHGEIDRGRICSTLEPAVVAAAGFSADDVFLPGLLCLLINGHFLADWTLFKRMKVVPPDCAAEWDRRGFHYKHLWTVRPSQDRWETSWDDLVDEMYELSRQAIASVLKKQSSWVLPLSGGLDSRLIAAVGAELGSNLHTYAWGSPDSTDVVCSRQVARTLGLPWKRVELGNQYWRSTPNYGPICSEAGCTSTVCTRSRSSRHWGRKEQPASYLGFLVTHYQTPPWFRLTRFHPGSNLPMTGIRTGPCRRSRRYSRFLLKTRCRKLLEHMKRSSIGSQELNSKNCHSWNSGIDSAYSLNSILCCVIIGGLRQHHS